MNVFDQWGPYSNIEGNFRRKCSNDCQSFLFGWCSFVQMLATFNIKVLVFQCHRDYIDAFDLKRNMTSQFHIICKASFTGNSLNVLCSLRAKVNNLLRRHNRKAIPPQDSFANISWKNYIRIYSMACVSRYIKILPYDEITHQFATHISFS